MSRAVQTANGTWSVTRSGAAVWPQTGVQDGRWYDSPMTQLFDSTGTSIRGHGAETVLWLLVEAGFDDADPWISDD